MGLNDTRFATLAGINTIRGAAQQTSASGSDVTSTFAFRLVGIVLEMENYYFFEAKISANDTPIGASFQQVVHVFIA